eukprot:1545076-Pyramimonas_sp.AAC.1
MHPPAAALRQPPEYPRAPERWPVELRPRSRDRLPCFGRLAFVRPPSRFSSSPALLCLLRMPERRAVLR